MSITYSIAMFPELVPTKASNISSALNYAKELQIRGVKRIAIRGRLPKYADKVHELVDSLQGYGFDVIMYTGIWGGVDFSKNPNFLNWAQIDKSNNPLGYGASLRSGMLCPSSPYIEKIIIPEITQILSYSSFQSIFFDIPWFMKGACNCKWCSNLRKNGASNGDIVAMVLKSTVKKLKQKFPNIKFAVNSSAPGLNHNHWTGGHINNLANIFDEYITEWNPYRWKQNVDVVKKCISKAKTITSGKFSHATTVTTNGKLYSPDKLQSLFTAILSQGATPWLSAYLNTKALNIITNAYAKALESIK